METAICKTVLPLTSTCRISFWLLMLSLSAFYKFKFKKGLFRSQKMLSTRNLHVDPLDMENLSSSRLTECVFSANNLADSVEMLRQTKWRGVWQLLFRAEHVSDPNSNNVLTVFTSPRRAARCNGVFPCALREKMREGLSSIILETSSPCPCFAAMCNTVLLSWSTFLSSSHDSFSSTNPRKAGMSF